MRGPITAAVSLAAAALLLAGCGDSEGGVSTGVDETAAAATSPTSTASTAGSASDDRRAAVVAWLQDPEQGYGLSDPMAACEAEKLLASDLPAATLDKVISPTAQASQGETDDFMAALGEADQACVQENPDDPAAP